MKVLPALVMMECVAFHFLNKHVGRHIMTIFQEDNVKNHQIFMHLLMEINAVMLFPSRGASVFGQGLVLTMHSSQTLSLNLRSVQIHV